MTQRNGLVESEWHAVYTRCQTGSSAAARRAISGSMRAEMASNSGLRRSRLQGGPVIRLIRPGGCKRGRNKETLGIPVIPQLTADWCHVVQTRCRAASPWGL